MEFSLVLMPLLLLLFVLINIAWGIFARSTLQWAVRYATETGVNATAAQLAGTCLTPYVKSLVQNNSVGLLSGTSGLALIKVNYLQPPAYNSSGAPTDVSTQSTGDAPGNIMEVSVQNYSQPLLIPLIFSAGSNGHDPDRTPITTTVFAADMIENTGTIPCIGAAP